jgi:hypothetical protein
MPLRESIVTDLSGISISASGPIFRAILPVNAKARYGAAAPPPQTLTTGLRRVLGILRVASSLASKSRLIASLTGATLGAPASSCRFFITVYNPSVLHAFRDGCIAIGAKELLGGYCYACTKKIPISALIAERLERAAMSENCTALSRRSRH